MGIDAVDIHVDDLGRARSRGVSAVTAGTEQEPLLCAPIRTGALVCGPGLRHANSPNCSAAVDTSNARIRDELPAKLDQAYAAISAAAPNVREVVVLGYGRFFGPNLACPTAFGFTGAEATRLNGVADNLDAMISARVSAAGFDDRPYSTVTLLARLRGRSTSRPSATAAW